MQDFIKIHNNDNVAVALKPLPQGTTYQIGGNEVTVTEEIPQGHKFALCDLAEGDIYFPGRRIWKTQSK